MVPQFTSPFEEHLKAKGTRVVFVFVDCGIGENLNNKQIKKKEYCSATLVSYVQRKWGVDYLLLQCPVDYGVQHIWGLVGDA